MGGGDEGGWEGEKATRYVQAKYGSFGWMNGQQKAKIQQTNNNLMPKHKAAAAFSHSST